ncbi:MAG: hypothetical protein RIR91_1685 [Verrucomicrobiota bacterium]
MFADEFDGTTCIHHRDDPRLLVVATRDAVTQDRRADALGVEATGHLRTFVLFSEDAVAAAGADDDEGSIRLGGWPDDELGDHHVGTMAVLVENALRVLARLRLERFGRRDAVPDGAWGLSVSDQ